MDFENFKKKHEIIKINETQNTVSSSVVISICIVTYNHVNFIKKCLDSILIQKTKYPFEILLGEDDSSDGTTAICIEYASKYPDKIRLFLHNRKNNIMINGVSTGRFNFLYNLYSARGKYIAFCDGDDYWTNPLKLQKQVDFLEANPDFNICFHNGKILKGSEFLSKKIYKPNRKENINFVDLLKGDYTKTSCSIFKFDKSIFTIPVDLLQDTTLFLYCVKDGAKAHYINEDMAVYRIHEGGVWGLKSTLKQLLSKFQIYEYLLVTYQQQNYTTIIKHKLNKFAVEISFIHLKELNFKEFFSWQKKSFQFYSPNTLPIYYNLLRKYFFNKNLYKKLKYRHP